MSKKGRSDRSRAKQHNKQGLQAYQNWDIEQAVQELEAAVRLAPDESDYVLNLACALARSGDFDQALKALADFMRLEPQSPITSRFEQLFSSGMDEVEQTLTEKMKDADIPLKQIGAAIQMWMEYRITVGRQRLVIRKPETWASALDYTVRKVNLHPVSRQHIADFYGISDSSVRTHHEDLVETLDIMPCDYRYFAGEENPLDKLVEAAELLERLERQFQEA